MNPLDQLIATLSGLPGIGQKSGARIAHYILKKDKTFSENLARQIATLKDRIKQCSICGNYTEEDPCGICTDSRRDKSLLCVVEQPEDIAVLENTREYRGMFHVLGGSISPLDGIGPADLALDSLVKRVSQGSVKEIILALNPTVQGDTTSLYIADLFSNKGIISTRLASGIPVGGDLGYADRLTLTRSLTGRIPFGR